MLSADQIIATLDLQAHPEGGYFREVYRAAGTIPATALAPRWNGSRAHATAIYFMLKAGQISRLHRLTSDEQWHYYSGAPLAITSLSPDGTASRQVLGLDLAAGERPLVLIPAGHWFGAALLPGGDYTLIGCTVAPGFDFQDFELGTRAALQRTFPQHSALIADLTPP